MIVLKASRGGQMSRPRDAEKEMKMTKDYSTRTRVLNDPATSYWLKNALRSALDRDIVDALSDAERLVNLLKAEYACVTGEVK